MSYPMRMKASNLGVLGSVSNCNRLTKPSMLEKDVNGIINNDQSNTIRLRE